MNRPTLAALAAVFALLAPVAHAQAQPPAPSAEPAPPAAPAQPAEKPQRLSSDKFQQIDTNHDGAISREEAGAAPMLSSRFDEIDSDKDGRVLPAELKAYAKTHRNSMDGAKGMKGRNKLDANQDGEVTRDEVAGHPKALAKFDAADTDKDGRLSREEARAAKGK
jgi:hypothetical protein